MNPPLCLNDIKPGEKARVCCLTSCGSIRRRFLDIGLTENTLVECVGVSPLGDPAAYAIRGAVIAIRKTDSKNILITGKENLRIFIKTSLLFLKIHLTALSSPLQEILM